MDLLKDSSNDEVLEYIYDLGRQYGIEPREYDKDPHWESVYVAENDDGAFSLSQTPLNTDEVGPDGTRYIRGIVSNLEKNRDFAPRKARGLRSDPGALWALWRSDPVVMRWWQDLRDALVSADWRVDVPEGVPEDLADVAEQRREKIERALFGVEGGWSQFVSECVYSAITGFVLFEVIDHGNDAEQPGAVKKAALRRSHAVNRWVLDDDERHLVAVEFNSPSGKTSLVEAQNLLLVRINGFGLDFEGMSPLRSVARYVEAKQILLQIEMAAASRRGAGILSVESDPENKGSKKEDKGLIGKLASMLAKRFPIIKPPAGYRLNLLSPSGTLPDFDALRRWLNQQIAIGLRAEGSLVGLDDHGSYALAETKDGQQTRSHRAFARVIEEAVNGVAGALWSGLIPRMEDRWGGPVASGKYCYVTSKAQKDTKSEGRYADLAELIEKGAITWTREDEQQLRGEFSLPPLPEDHDQEIDEEDGEDDDEGDLGFGWSNIDVDRMDAWLRASERKMGAALRRIGLEHRKEFVRRAKGVTSQREIIAISEQLRSRYRDRYVNAVRGEIMRMVARGSASTMAEIGIIPKLPQVPADGSQAFKLYAMPTPEARDIIDATATRIGTTSFKITDEYLRDREIVETIEGVRERAAPDIPSESAYTKHAARYVSRPFQFGREQIVQRIKNAAEDRGFPAEIIAEYTSVLEKNTCDICKKLDGTRAIVGSSNYGKLSPPNKCKGGDRCQCIWTYIMPGEAGYGEILDELFPDWRQQTLLSREFAA